MGLRNYMINLSFIGWSWFASHSAFRINKIISATRFTCELPIVRGTIGRSHFRFP
jgi:hypothetical protein